MTFSQAFESLLKIQSAKAKNTYDQTKSIIAHLKPWFEEHCPFISEFEKNYEEIWISYIAAQKPGRKLTHDRRFLVMALKRAFNRNLCGKAFTKKDFYLNQATRPIGRALTDEEASRILLTLKPYPKAHLQVLMALTMGMRISEILHLKVEEVDLIKNHIDLDPRRLKIRRRRKTPIPISNSCKDALMTIVRESKGEYVFPASIRTEKGICLDYSKPQSDNRFYWSKARKESGVKCRFHDLRHTAISNALALGMPPLAASKIFGASIQVIDSIYDHIRKETADKFRGMFDGRFNHETGYEEK